jgi:hypothetical protein
VECRFQDETIWLSQALIAELFTVTMPTVNEHLKNIYDEQELDPGATIRKFRIVRREGKREVAREIEHYSLDAILAVGYRVRSPRGTQFRRWATERLREYLLKGFVLDDQRLKNPPAEGSSIPDYFDELLERIRDIRASERRMYLRVKEIFALAGDYDPSQKATVEFFKIIQNKLHFAATGQTAAELIARRASHALPNMGLTTWSGEIVRKHDVTMAKNYLKEEEIGELNRVVTMCSTSPRTRPAAASRSSSRTGRSSSTSSSASTSGPCCPMPGRSARSRPTRGPRPNMSSSPSDAARSEKPKASRRPSSCWRTRRRPAHPRRNERPRSRTPRNRPHAMKRRFEANLNDQLAAIESVCDLFRGQERGRVRSAEGSEERGRVRSRIDQCRDRIDRGSGTGAPRIGVR